MKDKQVNELFIGLIKNKIKDEKKIVSVLSNILDIQKDVVYRRLRHEVAFTFSEIAEIAYALSISPDHIISLKKQYHPYHMQGIGNSDRLAKLRMYTDHVINITKEKDCEYVEVSASIPVALFFGYDYLLKWYLYIGDYRRYYKEKIPLKKFHEFKCDVKFVEHSKILATELKKFAHSIFIINNKFLESLIKDLKIFIEIKCINKEDAGRIKEELNQFIDYLEKTVTSGCYPETAKKVSVYVSNFKIHSGFSFIRSTNYTFSVLKLFSFNSVFSINKEVFEETLNWFESYERLSVLISVSCEMGRSIFFEEQRRIIDTL